MPILPSPAAVVRLPHRLGSRSASDFCEKLSVKLRDLELLVLGEVSRLRAQNRELQERLTDSPPLSDTDLSELPVSSFQPTYSVEVATATQVELRGTPRGFFSVCPDTGDPLGLEVLESAERQFFPVPAGAAPAVEYHSDSNSKASGKLLPEMVEQTTWSSGRHGATDVSGTCCDGSSSSASFCLLSSWMPEAWNSCVCRNTTLRSGNSRKTVQKGLRMDEQKFREFVCGLEKGKSGIEPAGCCSCLAGWSALSPMAPVSVFFDFIFAWLVLYDFLLVPMMFFPMDDENGFTAVMLWVVRIFWSLAMPRSAITGYHNVDGSVEMRLSRVGRHYMKTWLIFDCVVVGTDWVELVLQTFDVVSSFRILKTARVLRIIKVLRLVKIVQVPRKYVNILVEMYSERVHLLFCILKSTIIWLFLVHYLTCIWYGIGTIRVDKTSWIEVYMWKDASTTDRYWTSAHWAITQFIGSMSVQPTNTVERAFSVATLAFTFVSCAAFVSNLTAFMTQLHILDEGREKQFRNLQNYLRCHQITPNLASRVITCARYEMGKKQRAIAEAQIELLSEISEPLLKEIHYEVYASHLTSHPFFKRYHLINPMAMQKICHSAVTVERLSYGDLLFIECEEPQKPRMFFVMAGTLAYMKDGVPRAEQVREGAWACEEVLWTRWSHVGSLRAANNCQLLALDAHIFRDIMYEYKQTDDPCTYAQMYVQQLNEAVERGDIVDDITDAVDAQGIVARIFPHPLAGKGLFHSRSYSAKTNVLDRSLSVYSPTRPSAAASATLGVPRHLTSWVAGMATSAVSAPRVSVLSESP